jgi:competence protein ComEA
MPDLDPRRLAAWGAAALVLLALTAWYLARARSSEPASAAPVATIAVARDDGGDGAALVVDVAGAVRHPGVYRMTEGARVRDAITRAGGATARADLGQINRAAKLSDGLQVLVPRRLPAAHAAPAASGGAGADASSAPAQPVDLNSATLEQLDTLDGVGPATAQKIIDFRTQHGGFSSVDELDQVPGIGAKKLAALRPQVRV